MIDATNREVIDAIVGVLEEVQANQLRERGRANGATTTWLATRVVDRLMVARGAKVTEPFVLSTIWSLVDAGELVRRSDLHTNVVRLTERQAVQRYKHIAPTATVEALQLKRTNYYEARAFVGPHTCGTCAGLSDQEKEAEFRSRSLAFAVETPSFTKYAHIGDWIVKDDFGGRAVYTDEAFKAMFEAVE